MERTWIKWILGLLILGVAGCSTLGSSGGKGTFKPQQLSEEEQRRISHYGELRNGILVDELRTAQPNEPILRFHNERISYEGVLLLRYLGLRDVLGFEESEQFVRAVFEKIPTDNPDGVPLRNIVVPRWYQKGFPLVLQISTVFIKEKTRQFPAIVLLMNVNGAMIDQFGVKMVRQLNPQYQYPRFFTRDNTTAVEADGVYLLVVQGNMRVSSSTRMSGDLPSLDSAKTPRAKLNLTDAYLRDENPKNDSIVFPVLKEIYENEKSEPLDRLHAGLQMFLYYFFQQDTEKAEEIAEQLKASPLLDNTVIARMELPSIIREDLPLILKLNRGFYR